MNAKFEKWFEEDGKHMMCGIREAEEIWHTATESAIQSLEVTPELRNLAIDAYESAPGVMQDTAMQYALIAVLSALKEQAK